MNGTLTYGHSYYVRVTIGVRAQVYDGKATTWAQVANLRYATIRW